MSDIKAWLSFYLELPFHLGLPTGHYAFHIPNQLKIHRDIYYFQKGNEIENPSTLVNWIVPQEKLFNEKGLCDEEYKDLYKRKLKSTIFRKYTIKFTLLEMTEDEFYEKVKNKEINYKNLRIPNEMVLEYQKIFIEEVNTFLRYYINFFPENNPQNTLQHEVRQLSVFEISDCLLEPMFIVKIDYIDYAVLLRKIILDFHEQTGIPSLTYTNNEKIEEFEKIIQDRNKYKIFPYQDLFNMSRTFYRTHRETMTSAIIVNALMALESVLSILEVKVPKFINHKIERKSKSKTILYFYTDFKANYLETFLENELGYSSSDAKKHVIFFNHGRNIRNQIVHELELKFDKQTDFIEYTQRDSTHKITLKELWEHLLKIYNDFNIFILELVYPDINWKLISTYDSTAIGIAAEDSEHSIVPIFPDRDWRETYSYHYDLPDFAIPPERIARGIQSSDGKIIPLNFDPNKVEFEYFNQINLPEKKALIKADINILTLSEKELNEHIVNRDLLINFVNDKKEVVAKYVICKNCGNFCSVNHLNRYKKENCPICAAKVLELGPST